MGYLKTINNKMLNYPGLIGFARNFFGSAAINNSYIYARICRAMAKRYNQKRRYGNLRLNIETTLVCNARCLMCTRESIPENKGVMAPELFRKIIDEAAELKIERIVLSVFGEPLADPHFVERAGYVNEKNITFAFFSNGSLLTESKARQLLALERFRRVNFSVNAFDADIYNKVMVGLDRDRVYENILRFLKLREESGSQVKVRISGVVFDDTRDQMKKLQEFWSSQPGVDNVYFPVIRNRAGATLDVQKQGNEVTFSPLARKGKVLHPCRFLWEDLFIYWDGKVGVCCEDTAKRRIVVGDANKTTLKDIWTGKDIKTLRKLHLEGKRASHPVCGGSCTYNSIWLKP